VRRNASVPFIFSAVLLGSPLSSAPDFQGLAEGIVRSTSTIDRPPLGREEPLAGKTDAGLPPQHPTLPSPEKSAKSARDGT
jgi:hypothetical protein